MNYFSIRISSADTLIIIGAIVLLGLANLILTKYLFAKLFEKRYQNNLNAESKGKIYQLTIDLKLRDKMIIQWEKKHKKLDVKHKAVISVLNGDFEQGGNS